MSITAMEVWFEITSGPMPVGGKGRGCVAGDGTVITNQDDLDEVGIDASFRVARCDSIVSILRVAKRSS